MVERVNDDSKAAADELGVSEYDLTSIDEVLLQILADNPGMGPDDLTDDILQEYMMRGASKAAAIEEVKEEAKQEQTLKTAIDDMTPSLRPKPFPEEAAIFHETDESRRARAKAECTSAAVEVFKARNIIDELMLQIVQVEQ